MSSDYKVFVTRKLPDPALELLRKNYKSLEINEENRALTKEELKKAFSENDGVLCLLTDSVDSGVLERAEKLKIVANYAVGYNNIDVKECTRRGILVTNTPGVLTETTADLAWALLMSVARRIVESDRYVRADKFVGWEPMLFLGRDIFGKTLGIIGMGRIGYAVAKRATGFGMKVLYADNKTLDAELEKTVNAERAELDRLLKESDFISVHVPLDGSTKHLIGEKEFGMMKNTAVLINTSRGPVIDENALVKALKDNVIAGAGLDVYEEEPKLAHGLKELNNTVIVPHIGSATVETRTKMAMMAAENLIAGLEGELPPNCVNPEVYKKESK